MPTARTSPGEAHKSILHTVNSETDCQASAVTRYPSYRRQLEHPGQWTPYRHVYSLLMLATVVPDPPVADHGPLNLGVIVASTA